MKVRKIQPCPRCGSRAVRRSQSHGPVDAVMRALSRKPYRCILCGRRFYVNTHRRAETIALG